MKYYTQFLEYNLAGDIWEALGSDGVFILDGRNKVSTMIEDSRHQMKRLKNVQPHYIGFAIMRGSRFDNSTEIYREITK